MSRKKITISELNLKNIGDRIAFVRLSNNMTQSQFADLIGISKGNLSVLENNINDPSFKPLVHILEKFHINPLWLMTGKGDPIHKFTSETHDQTFKDSSFNELYDAFLRILNSGNVQAITTLENNIKYLDQTEKRLDALESKLNQIEDKSPQHKRGATA